MHPSHFVQQFAHISSHGEVESSETVSISGKLIGSSCQEAGSYSDMVIEAGIVKGGSLSTASTTVYVCLREERYGITKF